MNSDARAGPTSFLTVLGVGLAAFAVALAFFFSFEEPFSLRGDNKFVHFPMLLSLQGALRDVVDPTVGSRQLAVLSPFLGGATLMLAIIALAARTPRSALLAAVALLAAAASLGDSTFVCGLVSKFPFFEFFRGPHKFFLITQLFVIWLAALGLDALLRRRSLPRSIRLPRSSSPCPCQKGATLSSSSSPHPDSGSASRWALAGSPSRPGSRCEDRARPGRPTQDARTPRAP